MNLGVADYNGLQANIALSLLRGFICQRTEHLCTCAPEHSSAAEVTSD